MKRLTSIFLLLSGLLGTTSKGIIVEYPLSNLLGDYSFNDSLPSLGFQRYDSLIYSGPQAVIHSISCRYSGSTVPGLKVCCLIEPYCPDTSSYYIGGTSSVVTKNGSSGYWWGGEQIPPDELFQTQGFLESHSGFGVLSPEDVIQIDFLLYPTGLVGLCTAIIYPEGTITEAILVIDLDYTDPIKPTTWGCIKALYDDSK